MVEKGLSLLDSAPFGAICRRPMNNASVQPLGARSLGMMLSPARGGKRRKLKLNNLDGQLCGDWQLFNAPVDLMTKEAWGLLVVRSRPTPPEAVPGGAHCHPIPISHTRAHCERTERPSSFLPHSLLDLFGQDKDHPFEHA